VCNLRILWAMSPDKQPSAPSPPSVWATDLRRPRAKPTLSRERIVVEAIGLADSDGLEALSMRKLGTQLGVGATSIYWHVASKEQLVELIVDHIYGELEVPEAGDGSTWRDDLRACADGLRQTILRHPWMATMLAQSATAGFGPNAVRVSEWIIGVLRSAGLSAAEADQATGAVASYVLGTAGHEAAWLQMLDRSGQSEAEILAQMMPAVTEAVKDAPHTREVLDAYVAAYAGRDPVTMRDEAFDYGLELMLDGLEVQIARRGGADGASATCGPG
jgi:AcrR family transcriptional regulator